MGIDITSVLTSIAAVIGMLLLALVLYFKKQYRYWNRSGIKTVAPSIPFGSLGEMFKKNFFEIFRDYYLKYSKEPVLGVWVFHQPALMVQDPELVKDVLVRDFMSFHDRGFYYNEEDDPLSAHLLSMNGKSWKTLRTKLTPTFTSGKMKMMFDTVLECADLLVDHLSKFATKQDEIEVKEMAACYTTDVIASCAFGIKADSIINPDAIFRKMGRRIVETSFYESFKNILAFFAPGLSEKLKLTVVPKVVEKFFLGAVKETVEYREKNNIERNDFMQLMIQLKNKGFLEDGDEKVTSDTQKLTINQIAAQAFLFFIGGFETSSTTMMFALYELAQNKKMQDRVRKETEDIIAKHGGKLTYEAVMELDYMDRVVAETLRKYPVIPFIGRISTKPYKFKSIDLEIPANMTILIPSFGMQYDPRYYPEPEIFDPDRFTNEGKASRHHFTYLPFGEGPRSCIGNRFGLMQTKTGLATLLYKYQFDVCSSTPIPVTYEVNPGPLRVKDAIKLKISPK